VKSGGRISHPQTPEANPAGVPGFVTIAHVLKSQGRHGEVAVESHSDVPGRFHVGLKLSSLDKDGRRRELEIEGLWPHKGALVLKLRGVDSISQAEQLLGCELQVAEAERAALEPGWTYVSDLVGCMIFDADREVGRVRAVKFGAGEAPLLEVEAGSLVCEIPYAQAFLESVDVERKQIHMTLPAGLLEVNAPLTREEKMEQQKGNKP
jgi:16S rRNA processing protein RimM